MRVLNVGVGAGASWIAQSFSLFRQQPGGWMSICSAWILMSLVLLVIPLFGSPLMVMLQPGFFAGFVLAARDQQNGEVVGTRHLFAGFKASGRLFIMIGAITLLMEATALMLFDALGLFAGLREVDTKSLSKMQVIREMSNAITDQGGLMFGLMATVLLIKGVLWYTAALIAYRPMPPWEAIRWSAGALLRNFTTMLLFALLMFSLMTLAMMPYFLGMLVFFPIYAIAHYVSFMAVFDDGDEIAAAPPAES
jgi:uncharacterized membrane protein